jgi:hypothetical protein
MLCKLCFQKDGVESSNVVEHRCTNARTGRDFTAFVCALCLEANRETRVTCRTFIPIAAHKSEQLANGVVPTPERSPNTCDCN